MPRRTTNLLNSFERFIAKGPEPMPARWSEILLTVMSAMDDADRELSDTDRNCFYAQLVAAGLRRRERRLTPTVRHPLPNGDPLHSRDPSGGS